MDKILIFTYDFPHKKTNLGLDVIHKFFNGDVHVIASPKKKLNFYKSKIRVSTNEEGLLAPEIISKANNWDFVKFDHDSEDAIDYIKKNNIELGIILGARILKEPLINTFKIGIINFHPGLLPYNKGLDNLKWVINLRIPQGVTSHFIDKKIDEGRGIYQDTIQVNQGDNLQDLDAKLLNLQMNHLLKMIETNFQFREIKNLTSDNKSFKSMPWDIEKNLINDFEQYKKNYKDILSNFKTELLF